MILIGYIFTALNYICYCTSRFVKEKKCMVSLDFLAKICTIIYLYCFGSLTGSYIVIVKTLSLLFLSKSQQENPYFKIR